MWWEARSVEEQDLQQAARRLLSGYRRLLEYETPIRGVGAGAPDSAQENRGYGPSLIGEWSPLVLVDSSAMQDLPPGVTRVPWEAVDVESPAHRALLGLDPPLGCLVEPVGPIAVGVAPGCTTAAGSAGVATVGLPVALTAPAANGAASGFLTVAHGVQGNGSSVTVSTRGGGWLPAHVAFRDESARSAVGGDDIALVLIDPPGQLGGWLPNSGVQAPPLGPPYPVLAVDLFGSQSGPVLAQVNGTLLQLGDQTWQWLDCWELGATTPPMRPGDSGAVAVGPTVPDSILGHFVGGSVALRGSGFTHHWVQDLGQVLSRQQRLDKMVVF